jgi:hypothetical protein
MAESDDADAPNRLVIWEKGGVVCTSLSWAPDDIEIAIAVDGVIVQRQRFSDNNAAAAFAVDKMRAYYTF